MLALDKRRSGTPAEAARDVVLFVDDQPEVLASLRRLLRDEAFEVITTTSPREALRRVARGDVSLLVTDERMPRVRGSDLLERVQRRSPGTLRVVLTGYPGSYTLQYGLSHGVDWLISKPWNDEALKATLRRLLDQRSSGRRPPPAARRRRASAPSLDDLGEACPAPMMLLAADGGVRWANPAFLDLVGQERGEVVGHPVAELLADPQAVAGLPPPGGDARALAWRLRRRKGGDLEVSVDAGRMPEGTALLVVRPSEAETGARLLQGQKLLAVGELAAGIAHEINTPVGYILSNLTTLEDYVKDLVRLARACGATAARLQAGEAPAEIVAELEALQGEVDFPFIAEDIASAAGDSRQGAERIRDIVKGLRDFLHADEAGEAGPVDLNGCIENALRLCRNEIKYKAEVERDCPPLPPVPGPARLLEQVFVNLLINAAQAIDKKGVIRITTRLDGGRICARVADTGCGIPTDLLPRLFEPFFTTKPTGTGLGLHVAKRIVSGLGGTLEARSDPGRGSEFIVRLPPAGEGRIP